MSPPVAELAAVPLFISAPVSPVRRTIDPLEADEYESRRMVFAVAIETLPDASSAKDVPETMANDPP